MPNRRVRPRLPFVVWLLALVAALGVASPALRAFAGPEVPEPAASLIKPSESAVAEGSAAAAATAPPASPPPAVATAPAIATAPTPPPAHGSAAPSASASAGHEAAGDKGAFVRVRDRKVIALLVPRAGKSANDRAAAASQVLEHALEEAEAPEIRVDAKEDVAVLFVGTRPVIQLGPEDAEAAGDASLEVHAAAVAGKMREALKAARPRSAIATTVFSFSLVVFSALVAFLLLRKMGELVERMRRWMEEHPDRLPSLKVREIEVVAANAVRGGLEVSLSGAKLVAQIAIVYAWIIIALSLFDATRGYTERLTGFVLTPVSALMGRVASALPLLVLALITVVVVAVALRFVRLFFGSIARGETHFEWLPRDLATPTSFLVRFGMVVISLVIAAPLITGSDDGALSRAGVVSLVALGLAATPILASAAAGIAVVFGRRVSIGDYAIVAGRSGRVKATTMLEIMLEDDDGCSIHVPHLLSLIHPTKVLGRSPPVVVELVVSSTSALAHSLELITEAAARVGAMPRVDVLSLDADGARVRVSVMTNTTDPKNKLLCTVSEALQANKIPLGRDGAAGRTA